MGGTTAEAGARIRPSVNAAAALTSGAGSAAHWRMLGMAACAAGPSSVMRSSDCRRTDGVRMVERPQQQGKPSVGIAADASHGRGTGHLHGECCARRHGFQVRQGLPRLRTDLGEGADRAGHRPRVGELQHEPQRGHGCGSDPGERERGDGPQVVFRRREAAAQGPHGGRADSAQHHRRHLAHGNFRMIQAGRDLRQVRRSVHIGGHQLPQGGQPVRITAGFLRLANRWRRPRRPR
jgi:hypothetical protein